MEETRQHIYSANGLQDGKCVEQVITVERIKVELIENPPIDICEGIFCIHLKEMQ